MGKPIVAIPKELQVITEKQILDEVFEENDSGWTREDVQRVYDVLPAFYEFLIKEVKECSMPLTFLGRGFFSTYTLNNTGDETRGRDVWKVLKKDIIEHSINEPKPSAHMWKPPIIRARGLNFYNALKTDVNKNGKKVIKKIKNSYQDLVNFQNQYFFEEDRDYRDRREELSDAFQRREDIPEELFQFGIDATIDGRKTPLQLLYKQVKAKNKIKKEKHGKRTLGKNMGNRCVSFTKQKKAK